ncbi:MAG TPA: BPSS1780 family membrane protein [Casimicrobiaceae bacterium]|nr:BPSS1780 family membrane protein [Casimicrobiaceae bacterium]
MPADTPTSLPPGASGGAFEPNLSGGVAPSGGWSVGASHGATWWSDGWRIFAAAPWLWIGMTLLFVVLMIVLAMIPIVGHIASTLLYPVMGTGLLVGARDVDRHQPLKFEHLFSCFDKRIGPLLLVAVIYIAAWFVVWLVAAGICVLVFGLGTLSSLLQMDASGANLDLLLTFGLAALVFLLVVLVLGTPLVMAYWFAPPLVALRGDAPIDAFKASFHASVRNVPPLMIYGLVFIGLAILATIPFGLGWIVFAPVFVGSVYASYRDIFGDR